MCLPLIFMRGDSLTPMHACRVARDLGRLHPLPQARQASGNPGLSGHWEGGWDVSHTCGVWQGDVTPPHLTKQMEAQRL